jgi:dihydrofolate synthase/folylpolyglutamate synthase
LYADTFYFIFTKLFLSISPHISSFRERIQINFIPISEKEVTDHFPNIFSLVENHQIPATFFEITTALAFSYFDACEVDVVVLETGLGGRLDSTNIIQRPILSIITSIGLDHTKILGDTIELIAAEKAGK